MRLLYFNPENDLALAANDPHYTPPASALRMATDLQLLPLRWAQPDDLILLRDGTIIQVPDPPPALPRREGVECLVNSLFSYLKVTAPSLQGRAGGESLFVLPWGWSPLTVTDFLRAGVPADSLPSPEQMQAFRTVAGRATAAEVLSHLRQRLSEAGYVDKTVGEAHVCHSIDEARHWHAQFRESIFKQPWSGSGRGLLPAHDGQLTPKNEAWIARTLRQQGYVMAEPRYSKRLDFALEFWRHANGSVTYEGLSLFMTTPAGVYAGNIVDTEEGKRQRLSSWLPLSLLDATREALIDELSALPPIFYEGPLGVDLLITADGCLQPCIEINFRMTMGWLALNIKP